MKTMTQTPARLGKAAATTKNSAVGPRPSRQKGPKIDSENPGHTVQRPHRPRLATKARGLIER